MISGSTTISTIATCYGEYSIGIMRSRILLGGFPGSLWEPTMELALTIVHTGATAIRYIHIFTPTLTYSVHFGYQSTTNDNVPPNGNISGIPDQYGIQGVQFAAGFGGLPLIQFAPGTSAAMNSLGVSGYNPVTNNVTSLEVMENITKLLSEPFVYHWL
jgi:hypothetical protein